MFFHSVSLIDISLDISLYQPSPALVLAKGHVILKQLNAHRCTQTLTLTHNFTQKWFSWLQERTRQEKRGERGAFSYVMGSVSVMQSHEIMRPGNEETTRPLLAVQFNPSPPFNGKV